MERNRIKLFREHSQRLENAVYVGKTMNVLKKTLGKIHRKPVSLDPAIVSLKDNSTQAAKLYNWNVAVRELKKFGINIDADTKNFILDG